MLKAKLSAEEKARLEEEEKQKQAHTQKQQRLMGHLGKLYGTKDAKVGMGRGRGRPVKRRQSTFF